MRRAAPSACLLPRFCARVPETQNAALAQDQGKRPDYPPPAALPPMAGQILTRKAAQGDQGKAGRRAVAKPKSLQLDERPRAFPNFSLRGRRQHRRLKSSTARLFGAATAVRYCIHRRDSV